LRNGRPQPVDELIDRHALSGVHQQAGQDALLPGVADVDDAVVDSTSTSPSSRKSTLIYSAPTTSVRPTPLVMAYRKPAPASREFRRQQSFSGNAGLRYRPIHAGEATKNRCGDFDLTFPGPGVLGTASTTVPPRGAARFGAFQQGRTSGVLDAAVVPGNGTPGFGRPRSSVDVTATIAATRRPPPAPAPRSSAGGRVVVRGGAVIRIRFPPA
jgi:hypothetical protein